MKTPFCSLGRPDLVAIILFSEIVHPFVTLNGLLREVFLGRTDPKTSDPFFPMTPGILTARTSPFFTLDKLFRFL